MSRASSSTPLKPPGLASQLAARVLAHIARGEHAVGHRLTEQALAEAMGVSRTPVRRALSELERVGAVGSIPNRGFFVALPAERLRRLASRAPLASDDEEAYLLIAEDRLSGALPET